MANRSYLYSVDTIPSEENKDTLIIKGLSEVKYAVQLSYLILIGDSPQAVTSLIWPSKGKIGIIGNYDKGIQNLQLLFNLIRNNHPKEIVQYDLQVKKCLDFLSDTQVKQQYIQLEIGEVLGLPEKGLEEEIVRYIAFSKELVRSVTNNDLSVVNRYVQDNIVSSWEQYLGIQHWSHNLFFMIDNSNSENFDTTI